MDSSGSELGGWGGVSVGDDSAEEGWGGVATPSDDDKADQGWKAVASPAASSSDAGGPAGDAGFSDVDPFADSDAADGPGTPAGDLAAQPEAEPADEILPAVLTKVQRRSLLRPFISAVGVARKIQEELDRVLRCLFSHEGNAPALGDAPSDLAPIADADGANVAPVVAEGGGELDVLVAPVDGAAVAVGKSYFGREALAHQASKAWRDKLCEAAELLAAAIRRSPDPVGNQLQVQWKIDVASHYLFSKTRQVGIMAESEALGVSRRQATSFMQCSACAAIMMWRSDAAAFCVNLHTELLAEGAQPLCVTEHVRYDETPMTSKIKDPEKDLNASAPRSALARSGATRVAGVECESTHVVKVLQTERRFSMMYRLGNGNLLAVKLWVPCWLQSLGDGRAETYFQALSASRFEVPNDLLGAFPRKQRLVCTDADSAVLKCERCVSAAQPEVVTLHSKCEIHKAYRAHTSTFAQLPTIISKMKHIALSMSGSDGMRGFRVALRKVILRILDYRPNSAPAFKDYKQNREILDLMLPPADATSRLRRAIIMMLCNGNWHRRGSLVHHCTGPECCKDKAHCESKMTTFVVSALAGQSPKVWPNARWLGAELAISWLGLLQGVHGLLALAYCEWVHGSPLVSARLDTRCSCLGTPMLQDNPEVGPSSSGFAASSHDAADPGVARGGSAGGVGQDSALAGNSDEQKRLVNNQNKASASEWLSSHQHDAFAIFALIAQVLQPLTLWMTSLLRHAGEESVARKWADRVGDACGADGDGDGVGKVVPHQGLSAYQNVIESECLGSVRNMMRDRNLWVIMPPENRVGAMQARGLAMLACVGCQLHEVWLAHRTYPWKMFSLLYRDEQAARDILSDCALLRDEWSADIVKRYSPDAQGGLLGAACVAEVALAEEEIRRETAQIESKHASIRRSLIGLSVQTHCLRFPSVSALKATQEIRRLQSVARPSQPVEATAAASFSDQPSCAPAEAAASRPRFAGSWRAFVRQETIGVVGRPNFADLAEKYRELSPRRRARLLSMSSDALGRRRLGDDVSFGPTARGADRAAKKRKTLELAEGLAARSMPRADEVVACLPTALLGGRDVGPAEARGERSSEFRLGELRKSLRREATAKRVAESNLQRQLQDHMDNEGKSMVLAYAHWAESLEVRQAEIIPEPLRRIGKASDSVATFEWSSLDVIRRVKDALAGPCGNDHSYLLQGFQRQWDRLHETIDFHPFDFFDGLVEHASPCSVAGRCLCGDRGSLEQRFVRSTQDLLKAACPPAAVSRSQLSHGEIVVCVVGQSREAATGVDESLLWADDLLPGVPVCEALWLQVGHQVYKPYRTSYHKLCGPDLAGSVNGVPTHASLSGTCEFLSQWEAVALLNLTEVRWVGVVFALDFHLRPVVDFKPCQCDVRRLLDRSSRLLWCPWGRKRRRKASSANPTGWADVADAEDREQEERDAGSERDVEDDGGVAMDLDDDADAVLAHEAPGDLVVAEAGDRPLVLFEPEAMGGLGPADAAEADAVLALIDGAVPDLEPAAEAAPPALGAGAEDDAPGALVLVGPAVAAAPPAAPPPEAAIVAVGGDVAAPIRLALDLGFGTLTWYAYSGDFVAVCRCHAKCRKHRTSKPSGSRTQQGRPLGFLYAWLEAQHGYERADHLAHTPNLVSRQQGRAQLALVPGSAALLDKERPLLGDEPLEPLMPP